MQVKAFDNITTRYRENNKKKSIKTNEVLGQEQSPKKDTKVVHLEIVYLLHL